MLFALPDTDKLYAALLARDPAYDGHAFVGVTTTGVFCRLTCPARKPKPENTRFFPSISACLAAGFRPCQRCRPLEQAGAQDPLVAALLAELDRDPGKTWSEDRLTAMGLEPSTVRRAFRRRIGMTFLDLARLRRTARGLSRIGGGGRVIDAQLDAGFESGSGFRAAVIKLIGASPANLRGRELLKADWIDTPIGAMLAVADEQALHLLEFFDRKALPGELSRLRIATRSAITFGRSLPIDQIEAELVDYFEGRLDRFLTPLARYGSAFARTVWDATSAIPTGVTRSYADIATTIGRKSAVRAVATANGANQVAIVIPCHRVIGKDGLLTGYGGGLWRKRWLIEHERRCAFLSQTSMESDHGPS